MISATRVLHKVSLPTSHSPRGKEARHLTLAVVQSSSQTVSSSGIVSIYYFGTLLGCLMGGVLGDRLGRLKAMLIGGLWVMLGAALQCSAQNIAWMLCARVINGIGTGILNAIVPVWSAEVATHTSRGAFIAMEFTLNIFGVVVGKRRRYTADLRGLTILSTSLLARVRAGIHRERRHPGAVALPNCVPDYPRHRVYGVPAMDAGESTLARQGRQAERGERDSGTTAHGGRKPRG